MASRKRKRPEDHFDAIADVRDRGVLSEDDVPVLLSGIDSGHFRVVAFAARVLKNLGDEDTWARLEPRLLPAFKELIGDAKRPGHKKDPGCKAKLAIAEALADGMRPTDDVFSVGLSLVQYEPVFEGKEDSAASVRAACALGLAHMAHADAVLLISDLLADPEKIARGRSRDGPWRQRTRGGPAGLTAQSATAR